MLLWSVCVCAFAALLVMMIFSSSAHAQTPRLDAGRWRLHCARLRDRASGRYHPALRCATVGTNQIINLPSRAVNATPFLDISSEVNFIGEEGLLGLAFDPNYASNGRFYINSRAPGGSFNAGVSHTAEFLVSADPDVADPTSEATLFTYDKPQNNHNGGWVGFSPRAGDEGNLYISTGDGGRANDAGPGHMEPGGNAQNTTTLMGKMLRIHIEDIYGTLIIGDVGQSSREEIDVQKPSNPGGGQNYGWRV